MNIDAILTALLIPFAGTALGSAFVFGAGCRNGVEK